MEVDIETFCLGILLKGFLQEAGSFNHHGTVVFVPIARG